MFHRQLSRNFASLVVAIGATSVFIAAAPTQPPKAPSASAAGKHFLWKVTDASAPFYILGSIHALRGSDYPIGAAIDDAIGQCKRFVFEYDFEHVDSRAFSRKLNDAGHYPSGTNLRQKVSPKTYAAVQKIAKVRASAYDDVKPWAIGFMMYGNTNMHDLYGYYGVESYVRRKSRAYADVGGLETAEEHIHVLSDMSDIESEVFLLQSIVYGDRHTKSFGEAVRAWKTGDTHGLARMDSQEDREAPFIVQRMVTKRNANWIPKIEGEMKTGTPTMIVVGARHLCGPYSVIDLMRAKGHRLEQL